MYKCTIWQKKYIIVVPTVCTYQHFIQRNMCLLVLLFCYVYTYIAPSFELWYYYPLTSKTLLQEKLTVISMLVFVAFHVQIYAKRGKIHLFGWWTLICNPLSYNWSHLYQIKSVPLSFMGRYSLGGLLDPSNCARPLKVEVPWKAMISSNGARPRQSGSDGLG